VPESVPIWAFALVAIAQAAINKRALGSLRDMGVFLEKVSKKYQKVLFRPLVLRGMLSKKEGMQQWLARARKHFTQSAGAP
jgi:hypothetical protein